jgi:hypothetical protein
MWGVEGFPDLATLGDAELKALIDELSKEEDRVSFDRRVLQGRIDILRAGGVADAADDAALADAIKAALTGKAATAELSPEAAAELAELERQEQEISFRRRMLHGRIDILRAELVARLQRSGGESVLGEVDVERLSTILGGKAAPPTE